MRRGRTGAIRRARRKDEHHERAHDLENADLVSFAIGTAALLVAPGAEAQTYCQSYDDEDFTGSGTPPAAPKNTPYNREQGTWPAVDARWRLEHLPGTSGIDFTIVPFPVTGSPAVYLPGTSVPVDVGVQLLTSVAVSGIQTLPRAISFDLGVYVDTVIVKAYAGNVLIFEEEYAHSMTYEVVIEDEAGIDRVELITAGGESYIDNICISA